MAWIGLVDPTTKAVRPVAHAGVVDGYLEQLHIVLDDSPVGHFSPAQALCRGEVVIVESIADDPRMGPWREHALRLGYTASAAFPLVASGVVRGVLNLYTGESAFFDGEVVALLLEMAGDLAFAMEMVENENRRIDAQEARRETEDRLRLAVRAGRVGLWNWELDTNRVAYSAEWKAQLGYREEEIGDSFDEWESRVHPEDLAPTLSTVRSFLAAPWPNYHAEFRLRHKDGS
ncbi:MAG: GAF domain-containing protein, partial [Caldilineaceae bacterium]|nr:GAF domain-containing protein [Caldilineaceae bacterium]